MIIELTPTTDEGHLLVRLTDDKVVAPKKKTSNKGTSEKRSLEKDVEEVEESSKIESSPE